MGSKWIRDGFSSLIRANAVLFEKSLSTVASPTSNWFVGYKPCFSSFTVLAGRIFSMASARRSACSICFAADLPDNSDTALNWAARARGRETAVCPLSLLSAFKLACDINSIPSIVID